jgi:hypothetical protein
LFSDNWLGWGILLNYLIISVELILRLDLDRIAFIHCVLVKRVFSLIFLLMGIFCVIPLVIIMLLSMILVIILMSILIVLHHVFNVLRVIVMLRV